MNGRITLATGPMFSGKSSWIIEELKNKNQEEVLAIKYFLDNRYDNENISTHNGKKINARAVNDEQDILNFLKKNPKVNTLGIDELQFFKPSMSEFLVSLRKDNINVFAAGLNVDFNNIEWETTKKVKRIADTVKTFVAVCAVCKNKNATITNRKTSENTRVIIGGAELYEPLCEKDYLLLKSEQV